MQPHAETAQRVARASYCTSSRAWVPQAFASSRALAVRGVYPPLSLHREGAHSWRQATGRGGYATIRLETSPLVDRSAHTVLRQETTGTSSGVAIVTAAPLPWVGGARAPLRTQPAPQTNVFPYFFLRVLLTTVGGI